MIRRLLGIFVVSTALGCASAPRPVPSDGQPVATVEGAGLALTVPRLETAAYPDDVLELATPVFVAIENKGQAEIEIAIEDFALTGAGGMSYAPLQPQQLALRLKPNPAEGHASLFTEGAPVLAWRGGGGFRGGGFRGGGGGYVRAPAPAMGFRGGVRPAPSYGGGFRGGYGGGYRGGASYGGYRGGMGYRGGLGYGYRGGLGYRGGWGYRGGARVWIGPGYGGWWGVGPYAPYWWWGQDTYVRSRDDIVRYALAAGKLPPGGRIAGFLYFPRQATPESGGLLLRWQARDAASRAVIADMRVPLEINDDE